MAPNSERQISRETQTYSAHYCIRCEHVCACVLLGPFAFLNIRFVVLAIMLLANLSNENTQKN